MALKDGYLNAKEKQYMCMLASLIGTAEDTVDEWTSLDKETRKWLRNSVTFGRKAMVNVYKQISELEQRKIQRLADDLEFSMTAKAKKIFAVVDEEDAMDLAEMINEQHCKNCDGNIRNCRYRNILSLWGIDCFKVNSNPKCGYSYKEVKQC